MQNNYWSNNTFDFNGVLPPKPAVYNFTNVTNVTNEQPEQLINQTNVTGLLSSNFVKSFQSSNNNNNNNNGYKLFYIQSHRQPFAVEYLNNGYGTLSTRLGTNLGTN